MTSRGDLKIGVRNYFDLKNPASLAGEKFNFLAKREAGELGGLLKVFFRPENFFYKPSRWLI